METRQFNTRRLLIIIGVSVLVCISFLVVVTQFISPNENVPLYPHTVNGASRQESRNEYFTETTTTFQTSDALQTLKDFYNLELQQRGFSKSLDTITDKQIGLHFTRVTKRSPFASLFSREPNLVTWVTVTIQSIEGNHLLVQIVEKENFAPDSQYNDTPNLNP